MTVYVIAALVVGGGVLTIFGGYLLFFRTGKQAGAATVQSDTAKADLNSLKKADAIVMQQVSRDDLRKSLRDGTF